ncbi:50S ribosomal protein L18 [Candidatus Sumerlaeota bacterium]|nr:50S ribosomal protein L18 [Candidatus Sumerlaeota bacterium]
MAVDQKTALKRRHLRVRSKISGTAEQPRLSVHKSSRHLYAQLTDDDAHKTLIQLTTNRKAIREGSQKKSYRNVESAKRLGKEIGELAVKAGIRKVVFDRGGYPYHGIVKALADAAREAGLEF